MIMPGCPEMMTVDVDNEEDYLRLKKLWEQQMGDYA